MVRCLIQPWSEFESDYSLSMRSWNKQHSRLKICIMWHKKQFENLCLHETLTDLRQKLKQFKTRASPFTFASECFKIFPLFSRLLLQLPVNLLMHLRSLRSTTAVTTVLECSLRNNFAPFSWFANFSVCIKLQ